MAEKTNNDEFIQKITTEAWKNLSELFSWTETLLEKYRDKVDWSWISKNRNIHWTIPMIQKFKSYIDWKEFSSYATEETLIESVIATFKDKWYWQKLSGNPEVTLSFDLLDKFADFWDWEEIIDRPSEILFEENGMEFYERYKERIPVNIIPYSCLWYGIVYQMKRQLIAEITA